MKRRLILLLLLTGLLSGCAGTDSQSEQWYMALDSLKQQENYTVEEITCSTEETTHRVRQYDLIRAKTEDPEQTLYYSIEDGVCYGIGWVEDPGVWGRQEIERSDFYFYDYLLLDRLNQLSGLVDMGLLEYRKEDNTYVGKNLTQRYVYRDLEHQPLELEITLENGLIVKIHEIWQCTKDGEDLGIYEDTMDIFDFSTTQVRLPNDIVNAEEE